MTVSYPDFVVPNLAKILLCLQVCLYEDRLGNDMCDFENAQKSVSRVRRTECIGDGIVGAPVAHVFDRQCVVMALEL